MTDERSDLIIQSNNEFSPTMLDFENKMMCVYHAVGLPVEDILVPVNERRKVFKNFMDVLEIVPRYKLESAHFITKFMTAASVGLFDSALNHLWVETIKQLKIRIQQYDIDYFYDVAIPSERRDEFSTIEDLDSVDEVQLLDGARKIELLTEKGYRQLDHIKYMLGYMEMESSNQSEVSGTELISWLEICVKEVILLEIPSDSIQAQMLLKRIRDGLLDSETINNALAFISNMSVKYANVFAKGIFGLYIRQDTDTHIKMNIKAIAPTLWQRIDGATKNEFATTYAIYSINQDREKAKLARAFIAIVGGEEYLPDNVRGYEIKIAINQLLSMHRGRDNFYTEPQFARRVEQLVGSTKIPLQIDRDYVLGIIEAFLTNGNGECWAADTIYVNLIHKFTERQSFIAVTSFNEEIISNKLQYSLCKEKFREMLSMVKDSATNHSLIEFIDYLIDYKGRYSNLAKETRVKQKVESLRILYR